MELAAFRGRNQKGISFVHSDNDSLEHQVSLVTYRGRRVCIDVRVSQNVPSDSMILDSRLFDELECQESSTVEVTSVDESIPICNEITLSVESLAGLDNRKVVQAVSSRIEDFKEHIDGLVFGVNQTVSIPELKLRLTVHDLRPASEALRVARVSWKNVLKVSLSPSEPSTTQEELCFNLCIVSDVGASAKIADIVEGGDPSNSTTPSHEGALTRRKTALLVLRHLLTLPKTDEGSMVASIAYGEEADSFSESGLPDDTEKLPFDPESLKPLDSWLSRQFDMHSAEPSNPGSGLLEGLRSAAELSEANGLPTAVVLLSGGAFSAGRNPVSVVRDIQKDERVSVFCIALGAESDYELLEAIANVTEGQILSICHTSDVVRIGAELSKWGRCNG
ncbi:MAG: hypothetical protein JSW05_03090 [Candidatus Thorarchaeota archaeon]|nr:MAG: hypothetical protein JSW05_03090 [Candidatus Thorarchaeota archaeon]